MADSIEFPPLVIVTHEELQQAVIHWALRSRNVDPQQVNVTATVTYRADQGRMIAAVAIASLEKHPEPGR
jgi:hypothetical protein